MTTTSFPSAYMQILNNIEVDTFENRFTLWPKLLAESTNSENEIIRIFDIAGLSILVYNIS